MSTRITTTSLLVGVLLCGSLAGFAQTKPVTAPPVVGTPPPTTTPSVNVGQSVTINKTAYVVNAKKQLATGVEFYTMKPASPKAKAATFLRTKNTYNTTAFTQAQYQAFLNTWKISSFGTLKKGVVRGKNVQYITNGTTTALFAEMNGEKGLNMLEFAGGLDVLQADNGLEDPAVKSCKDLCAIVYEVCTEMYGAGDMACVLADLDCWEDCESAKIGLPASLHHVATTKPILFQ